MLRLYRVNQPLRMECRQQIVYRRVFRQKVWPCHAPAHEATETSGCAD